LSPASLRLCEVDLDGVRDIRVALLGAEIFDCLEHVGVIIGRLKLVLLEVRCEVIDVRAAAASKFEHLARWRKQRLEYVQYRVRLRLPAQAT